MARRETHASSIQKVESAIEAQVTFHIAGQVQELAPAGAAYRVLSPRWR